MTAKQKFERSKRQPADLAAVVFALMLVMGFGCSHVDSRKKPASVSSQGEPVSPENGFKEAALEVELSSPKVANGSVLRIDVKGTPADTVLVNGKFEAENVPFFNEAKNRSWTAFLPVSFYQKPGRYSLVVEIKRRSEVKPIVFNPEVEVIEGVYPSEVLKVAQKHVTPSKKDLIRIRKESVEIRAIYDRSTPEKLWNGELVLPVDNIVTSPFGVKRLYNGKLQNFHQGLDFRAPTGTPIMAPGDGRVVLAKDLFYTGNTVIIDHGFSIYTVYAHMSELKVRSGMHVSAKDLLGLSGSTGRATGPHLHWGAVVRKIKINPVDLMRVLR